MVPAEEIRRRLASHVDPAPRVASAPGSALAAVLVPVLASGPEPRVVFTRRTQNLSRHAGEISFPGGLADDGEEPAEAALREAREELGLNADDVELLGALPSVHTRVTGVLIVPFVGLLWRDPQFTPNAEEIDEILEFSLAELASRASEQALVHEGRVFRTDLFDMDGIVIWGATGRILRSFLDALAVPATTDA